MQRLLWCVPALVQMSEKKDAKMRMISGARESIILYVHGGCRSLTRSLNKPTELHAGKHHRRSVLSVCCLLSALFLVPQPCYEDLSTSRTALGYRYVESRGLVGTCWVM